MAKTARKKAAPAAKRKPTRKSSKASAARPAATKTAKRAPARRRAAGGRFAAPGVRLGMTAPEVRDCSGQPECILFGSEDHVEWQFGKKGTDPVGAPTLYVTTLTFAAGRVISITERMGEAT
ncbi:MAG: hypothetical protein ACF8XB_24200 [Planctomycetota bacterium JB042]